MAEKMDGFRRKTGIACMILGILLLGMALALLLFNQKTDSEAGNAAADILPRLQNEIDEKSNDTDDANEESALEIDGNGYIGYLTIPALKLELPVMSEWDDTKLKIAPCRYFGSAATDDLIICGHNYTRHFGLLKTLQAGDQVLFTDIHDGTISYQVEEIQILQPTETIRMIENDYDLTLYTCTYGGAARVTVRCNRTKESNTRLQSSVASLEI